MRQLPQKVTAGDQIRPAAPRKFSLKIPAGDSAFIAPWPVICRSHFDPAEHFPAELHEAALLAPRDRPVRRIVAQRVVIEKRTELPGREAP